MSELAPSYAELKLAEDEAWKLRAENKLLREALREAWPYVPDHHGQTQYKIREALKQ